uniref:DnaJ homolog dnj-20 n=1 Tax=Ascaris lumbricoides TaxID=6252 RepID=A0A0M3I529_ASCLU
MNDGKVARWETAEASRLSRRSSSHHPCPLPWRAADDFRPRASTHSASPSPPDPFMRTLNNVLEIQPLYSTVTTSARLPPRSFQRKVFSAGGSFYTEDAILEVPIKKGLRAGSRITFPNAGDRYPQKKADDLVVIIYDKSHQQYTRDKDDVTYKCNLPISDALCGCTLHIPLILGGTHQMTITEVIQPGTTRRIRGEGIPNNRTGVRGDLIVVFDINFPKRIHPDLKEVLRRIDE